MFSIDIFSCLFVLINLVVLYLGLRHFLFKPVNNIIEKRQSTAKADLDKAAEEKNAAEALRKEYEAKLAKAKETAQAIIEDTRLRSAKEIEAAQAEAKAQAERILKEGRAALQLEREQIAQELREEVSLLALSMATKIIEENSDTKANRALIERLLKARS